MYEARLRAGMVQEDIAHALRRQGFKTAAKSVSLWERGINSPRAEMIPALAQVLGITIEELYSSDDDEEDGVHDLARALLVAVESLVSRKLAEGRA